jgi:hypothetical protein
MVRPQNFIIIEAGACTGYLQMTSFYKLLKRTFMNSGKYGRTYHYPFSPGATSDDRIQHEYWKHVQGMKAIIHTEKLDGENNCLNRYGVFARSHAAPATTPWTTTLRQRWQSMKHDLGDLELFGENLCAIHSIEYKRLEHHYFVFAVRYLDTWLSWDEVAFYAAAFDLPTVPLLQVVNNFDNEDLFRQDVLWLTEEASILGSYDVIVGSPESRRIGVSGYF